MKRYMPLGPGRVQIPFDPIYTDNWTRQGLRLDLNGVYKDNNLVGERRVNGSRCLRMVRGRCVTFDIDL